MDKLLNIAGGQPLHVDDWALIQNQEVIALAAIINSLIGSNTQCILSGLIMTDDGSAITVTEGYLYASGEIFYVPAAHFSDASGCILYLVPNFSTTENRTFKDTSTHDVWAYREYEVLYQNTDPGSSLLFSSLSTLINILRSSINSNLTDITDLAYASGFSAYGSFGAISLQGNNINGYMLQAAFNASASSGKLCTIPSGLRPSADLVGFFYNNSVAPGILKIKKNGDVYVSGASTTSPNYITFQFYMRFEDLTLFSLPTTGGGLPGSDK